MNPPRPASGDTFAVSRPEIGIWQGVREKLRRGIHKLGQDAKQRPAEPVTPLSSAWYAGMVVEPAAFSEQLCNLQVSLQRACTAEMKTPATQPSVRN